MLLWISGAFWLISYPSVLFIFRIWQMTWEPLAEYWAQLFTLPFSLGIRPLLSLKFLSPTLLTWQNSCWCLCSPKTWDCTQNENSDSGHMPRIFLKGQRFCWISSHLYELFLLLWDCLCKCWLLQQLTDAFKQMFYILSGAPNCFHLDHWFD